MPFCMKCGAEVVPGAKFCAKCGAPVEQWMHEPEKKEETKLIPIVLAIVFVGLLIAGIVLAALFFLPINPVNIDESREVDYQAGVDTLELDFKTDVGSINIDFADLEDKLVTLDVSATGGVGVFGSTEDFDLTFDDSVTDNKLTVDSRLKTGAGWHSVIVICDIQIDNSLNSSLTIETITGEIEFNTQAGVVLETLNLMATTGSVEATLVEDVVLKNDISLETTTGSANLVWLDVNVTKDIQVDIETTTGGVDINFKQHEVLYGDIILNVDVTTGGIDFAIDIKGDLGAEIISSTTTGGINIGNPVGFSGVEQLIQSDNYQAAYNLDAVLKTTTGGIDIDASYTS